ncbi:unnamed protein product [Rotaria sordida]|uniref:Methyltransferase n=1 Tax=Rotaria sordida TaxID=392033 RepID=A0A814X3I3_9BILA|nr:unnamed protein product [Rotaria sordida]CAF1487241.1 unnamed protein product [Rotaria sordida]
MVDDVIGKINYLTTTIDGCPPWLIGSSVPTSLRSNLVQSPVDVTIHDLRGKEKSVNLDTNALEVTKYNGCIKEEFEEGSETQKIYYEEITDLLKKRLGASRVIIYHYTFRSRGSSLTDEECNMTHKNPVFCPHVDTDAPGVKRLVEKLLNKEEAERAMKNRIQIINIWRPLGQNPITEKPLAICDYQSVDVDKDVHPISIRGSDYHPTSYIMSRNYQDKHIWYYLSQMKSDEMFLFKIFDSKYNVAQFAFHTAFINQNAPTSNNKQKSLEIRCLIFYDK